MAKIITRLLPWLCCICIHISVANPVFAQTITIADKQQAWPVYIDDDAAKPVATAASLFAEDIGKLVGQQPAIIHANHTPSKGLVIAGVTGKGIISRLQKTGKLKPAESITQWEGYAIQMVRNPLPNVEQALVVAGNNPRGVAFGLLQLSQQFGVSPWYWWADVPVVKKVSIELPANFAMQDHPRVQYRGIFLNDEAPALSGWSKEKFGGFNSKFYSHVFELMLRLKANYIWPAMWGNAFYDDDSTNIDAAESYGIVIGTSHHEPLMRAHDEWRRYGTGKWNYDSNAAALKSFWTKGMQRATNEKIVSIGMRGDGDEPMSRETATALLERIVADQRKIIADVTRKPASETPQLWALYKEVQDYYDKGMRVPDDVTLLLCDDNWGNIRRLPSLKEPERRGGYGIYYHFDYVGGPRNYKWINTNHISRIWEQMHLAWAYKARKIWIVNVGDLKPMEFPISFFLDYAWNPDKIGANDLMTYTKNWSAQQFGQQYADSIAHYINTYTKYNSRRKPELLDDRTYSFNYNEWEGVSSDYTHLWKRAGAYASQLPAQQQDAYFQLVLHPIAASANLYELYYHVAKNKQLAALKDPAANHYAEIAKQNYISDSLITLKYHQLNNGKWNHMMSQTHIGYTYWQQPPYNTMPAVQYVENGATATSLEANAPGKITSGFQSIAATAFTSKKTDGGISWTILPDHGRDGDAITTFPVTATPGSNTMLSYNINVPDTGSITIYCYFSPTLNFLHTPEGLQYSIDVSGADKQTIGININDDNSNEWNNWVASNINIVKTMHRITRAGNHVIHFQPLHPGMVLQKIVVDYGGLQPSYLGPLPPKN